MVEIPINNSLYYKNEMDEIEASTSVVIGNV